MAAILLGELKEGLRFESVFGFDAEFLPTIDKEVALGRELFEQFDTTRVEVGAHSIFGVDYLQLRNDIYAEHLRLRARDCAFVPLLGEKA